MRRSKIFYFIFLCFLCFCSSQVAAQKEADNLSQLCRVWGLLKYYHPTVAHGQLNWDSVLVAHIPAVKKAKNKTQFEQQILGLINSAGPFEGSSHSSDSKDSSITFINWNWIRKDFQNAQIREKLLALSKMVPDSNVYVTNRTRTGAKLGFPRFTEEAYKNMILPTEEYRLLSLFRVWNIVQYFFPYKNLMDKSWDDILPAFIPKFQNANDTVQYHLLCMEVMTYLNDGHAFASSPVLANTFGRYNVPFEINFVENKYVVGRPNNDSLFQLTGLQPGDIIVSINGTPVIERIKYLRKYLGGSNRRAIERKEIADVLLRSNDTSFSERIGVIRREQLKEYKIDHYPFNKIYARKKNQPIWRLLQNNVGYVNIGLLQNPDTLSYLFRDMAQTRAMILDFRTYPAFQVMYPFLSYVYSENKPFAKFLSPLFTAPGYFYYHTDGFLFEQPKQNRYTGKIILLVNERSGSLGEFFPMALQMLDQTITIGSQTWGGDGNQVGTVLPGNIYIGFSGLGIFYPDGRLSQRQGIKVDIKVEPKLSDYKNLSDPYLSAAIQYLDKNQ